MGYWSEQDLPFYYGLARTFPLADHWFSSCLGPTFPNRRFLIAGTANGLLDDLPFHLLDYPPAGTIFDMLTRHEISWANYHPVAGDKSSVRRLAHYRRRRARRKLIALVQGVPQGDRGDSEGHPVHGRPLPDRDRPAHAAHPRHGPVLRRRRQRHAPRVQPCGSRPSRSSPKENPQDIQKGESFAAEVINRVMHGKGWPDTLLIWTYDENGGYYDHVAPPAAVPPDDVGDVPGRAAVVAAGRAQAAVS